MKHKLLSVAVLAAAALGSQAASAADGMITFTGEVADTTCKINGVDASDCWRRPKFDPPVRVVPVQI